MSIPALKAYAKEIHDVLAESDLPDVRVVDGTGRPRRVQWVKKFARESLDAMAEALDYAAHHGNFLLHGKNDGLKAARSLYRRLARTVGLVGVYAPHSLRYAYAVDKIKELNADGYSRQEALAMTAGLLGHGASRARYVMQVYGKTIVDTLPKTRRRNTLQQAAIELAKLAASLDNK